MMDIFRKGYQAEPLCSYFCSHSDVEKAGKVKTISRVLKDPMTKPWLLFLSNVLPVFEKLNIFSRPHQLLLSTKILVKVSNF